MYCIDIRRVFRNSERHSLASMNSDISNSVIAAFEKLSKNALPSPIVEIQGGHTHVTATRDMLVRNVQISTNA